MKKMRSAILIIGLLAASAVGVTSVAGAAAQPAREAALVQQHKKPTAHAAMYWNQVFNATWNNVGRWCYAFTAGAGWTPYQTNNINPEVFGPYANGVWYGHGFCVVVQDSATLGVIYRTIEIQFAFNAEGGITSAVIVDSTIGVIDISEGGWEGDGGG